MFRQLGLWDKDSVEMHPEKAETEFLTSAPKLNFITGS